jgi:tRNA threonylcarbamoyladenosine biosynthesis protein TsaB
MKTIALDTSAQPGALALLQGGTTIYQRLLPTGQRTSATFAVELREALRSVEWAPSAVDLFAVCEGPGSFTGLRIGITAAKTFAYATGCQLVAVNTLEVIASQVAVDSGSIFAVLDAQRQQLFVGHYRREGQLRELDRAQIVNARDWVASIPQGALVTGTGIRAWISMLPAGVNASAETTWPVQADQLGRLAVERHARGQTVDRWKLVPNYYRPSAAEEKH